MTKQMRCCWTVPLFLVLLCAGTAHAAKMVSVARDAVNLRSGPGKNYPVIWTLASGYPLTVIKKQGAWLKVRDFEGDTGWIHGSLTGRVPHLVVKREGARVRKGPGKKYPVLGKAERGVVLKIVKKQGDWVKIRYHDGFTGWMHRSLLWGW